MKKQHPVPGAPPPPEHNCTWDACGKSFNSKNNLVKHVRVVHENIRPFECEKCGKCFCDKSFLARHMGVHDRERLRNQAGENNLPNPPLEGDLLIKISGADTRRTHACEECPRKFMREYDLKRHRDAFHSKKSQDACEGPSSSIRGISDPVLSRTLRKTMRTLASAAALLAAPGVLNEDDAPSGLSMIKRRKINEHQDTLFDEKARTQLAHPAIDHVSRHSAIPKVAW